MSKIRILSIEDNPLHQENLFIVVEAIGYELVGFADNAKDALEKLFALRPDVVLMDIELKGDKDGIEIAEKIYQLRPTPLIFTTGRTDQLTLDRAKNTTAFSYLVKPIDENNLRAAIELAVFKFQQNQANQEAVLPENTSDVLMENSIFTRQAGKLQKIDFQDIKIIEVAKDRYCKITTKDNNYLVRTALKDLALYLPDQLFLQIHRSCIVNLDTIQSIDENNNTLKIDHREIPIGKTYREKILKRLRII